MATGQEVEKPQAAVPALVQTPALEITAEDVALPRLYIGQFSSTAVKKKFVDEGVLFTALGQDDPDPCVIWTPEDKEGVIFHVLGLRKGRSLSTDGELETWAYDDPDASPDAWVTYNYFVSLPELDPELPYKWLLTRSATPSAKQINMRLSKNLAAGPAWTTAFELTTAPRQNKKGDYFVPQVKQVEAKEANVKIAESMAVLISGQSAEVQATGDEPAI